MCSCRAKESDSWGFQGSVSRVERLDGSKDAGKSGLFLHPDVIKTEAWGLTVNLGRTKAGPKWRKVGS